MTPLIIIMWVSHMAEYYDYVLGLVPLTLVGITAALLAVGVESLVAIPIGAATASPVVGHALFVNGPVDRTVDAPSRPSTGQSPINAD
jgi:hypothetical protein